MAFLDRRSESYDRVAIQLCPMITRAVIELESGNVDVVHKNERKIQFVEEPNKTTGGGEKGTQNHYKLEHSKPPSLSVHLP